MTVTAIEFLSRTGVADNASSKTLQAFTGPAQREMERLTESLFFVDRVLRNRCVLMAEVGSGETSSLWLAAGVASILGKTIGRPVHILSIGDSEIPRVLEAGKGANFDPVGNSYTLERISDSSSTRNSGELRDRLAELEISGHPVIIHVPHFGEQASLLDHLSFVDGIVFLIRAGQTRRAALEAINRQIAATSTQVLGSVLLDRIYPIPEKLYRIL
jgi:hypothetical protein